MLNGYSIRKCDVAINNLKLALKNSDAVIKDRDLFIKR